MRPTDAAHLRGMGSASVLSFLLAVLLLWATPVLGEVPLPTEDPWFRPPDGWQSTTPGTVLRMRVSPYNATVPILNVLDTFQLLFRTTDAVGNYSWAVTTVFIPLTHRNCHPNATESGTFDPAACSDGFVTYGVPYDSINPNAVPSYLLQFRDPYNEIGLALARGWFVNAPDYEGNQAAFTSGTQAGYVMLDSTRAVLAAGVQFGLKKGAKNAMWGYSAGGQASGFAAEMAAEYAPELAIAGAVLGGPPPDVASAFDLANKRDVSGLIVASLLGITVQRPAAFQNLLASVHPEGPFNITGFIQGYYMTGLQALFYFGMQDIWDYFPGGREAAMTPELQQIYREDAVMGRHGTPNMPVFYYKALNDDFTHHNESDALVEHYCAQGANVLYHVNEVGGHNNEIWNGRQRVLYFLGAVLDGNTTMIEIPEKGCLWKRVQDEPNPATIA